MYCQFCMVLMRCVGNFAGRPIWWNSFDAFYFSIEMKYKIWYVQPIACRTTTSYLLVQNILQSIVKFCSQRFYRLNEFFAKLSTLLKKKKSSITLRNAIESSVHLIYENLFITCIFHLGIITNDWTNICFFSV